MIELVVCRQGQDLISIPLDQPTFKIGRAGTNDLAIPDPLVSRHQCLLVIENGQLRLYDKSERGTRVNGKSQNQCELLMEDVIQFGETSIRIRQAQQDASPVSTLMQRNTQILPDRKSESRDLVLCGRNQDLPLRFALKGDTVSIGSDPGNDLVLKDNFVSSFHCRLTRKKDNWVVSDLDSTNGTRVNGIRVGEAELSPGCVLELGQVQFKVELDSSNGQSPAWCGFVSTDPAMKPVFDMINRAAPTDEAVLITGPSGSGKELAARAIHQFSHRAQRSLVALNCAAITKDLMESELFGHERGAFTGAQLRRKGLFEEADQGSLFLDEIGELSLDIQAKLLRALENGEIRRVGSSVPYQVNVRVISATHRSLPELINRGAFREDLFYRICVIEIPIPPLSKRKADIPLLARHFLEAATRHTNLKKLSDGAIQRLCEYSFPGNVRELKHVITRAAILCPQEQIDAEHLLFSPPTLADRVAESKAYRQAKTLEEVEIETISGALTAAGGNQSIAAKELGIARSTLIQKIQKYGLCN